MLVLLVTMLVATPSQTGGNWPTLAETLRERHVSLPDGVDGAQRITSFAILDDARDFVIAYYDVPPEGLLRTLHVCAFDRRSGVWRAAAFDQIGSVVSVRRAGGLFFIEGHSSPSSGPILVLAADLTLRHRMDGWIVHTIDDGRILFVRGMRHFAPTHAEVLAEYDPAGNRDVSIYPSGAANDGGAEQLQGTDVWIDRTIGDIRPLNASTIAFPVTVSRSTIERDNRAHAAGAAEHLLVTCDVARRVPVCREEAIR